jgi:hypothetical protein
MTCWYRERGSMGRSSLVPCIQKFHLEAMAQLQPTSIGRVGNVLN